MKIFFSIIVKLFFVLSLFIITGCQTVDIRGQYVSDQAISEINSKKSSQEEVINLIGTPTYIPEYTSNTWYYVQRSLTKRAWFDPKVVEQRIVKITFNGNGRAKEATLISGSQNENISLTSNFTKVGGTEQSGIQKFVKNIGRFNKTTDTKSKRQKKKK